MFVSNARGFLERRIDLLPCGKNIVPGTVPLRWGDGSNSSMSETGRPVYGKRPLKPQLQLQRHRKEAFVLLYSEVCHARWFQPCRTISCKLDPLLLNRWPRPGVLPSGLLTLLDLPGDEAAVAD